MPNQDPSAEDYGPFTSALTGPLTPQLQTPSVRSAPTRAGSLALFANQFLQGAQAGQRTKYERDEQKKAEHERHMDQYFAHSQNDPNLNADGKKAVEQAYMQAKFSRVSEHLGKGGKDKDNPLINLTRTITGAVLGPSSNKEHKDYDVNTLMSIANDPKYRIDPSASGAEALEGVLGKAPPAAAAQPGGAPAPAAAAAPGASGGAPAAAPGVAPQPGAGGVPPAAEAPHELATNQAEAFADPKFRAQIARLQAQGIDWQKTQLGQWFNTLPKAGGAKPVGSPYTVMRDGKPILMRDYFDASTGHTTSQTLGDAQPRASANAGRPVNIGEALTIDGAKASGDQYEDALNPGHMIDLDDPKLSGMQLKGIGTKDGMRFMLFNPTNQTIRVGGRVYEVNSREAQSLAKGAGADLGPISGGTSSTHEVPVINAAGDTVAVPMQSTSKPNAPGIPGRPTAGQAAQPAVNRTPPPTVNAPLYMAPGQSGGLVQPGNIDLRKLPVINNGDGSYSTVYSTSFQDEKEGSPTFGKEVLVRGIIDGKKTDDVDALRKKYYKDGQHLGVFENGAAADAYGQRLHEDWANGKIKGVQMGRPGNPTAAQPPANGARPPASAAAPPAPGGGRVLPGMQAGERNTQMARVIPVRAAAMQMFGDPNQPDTKSLLDYAHLADDPDASKKIGTALQIAFDAIHKSQGSAGGFGEWMKNVSGAQQSIEESRTQVLNQSLQDLKGIPGASEAFNATIAAYSTAIGLRAISKASGSQASAQAIERDIPMIGKNTTGSLDFYDKLGHYAQEINDGTKGLGTQIFSAGEADYFRGGIQKKVNELRESAPDPTKKSVTNKAGHVINISDSVTLKDGKKHTVKGFTRAGGIITE